MYIMYISHPRGLRIKDKLYRIIPLICYNLCNLYKHKFVKHWLWLPRGVKKMSYFSMKFTTQFHIKDGILTGNIYLNSRRIKNIYPKKMSHVPKEMLLHIQLGINRGVYLRVTTECLFWCLTFNPLKPKNANCGQFCTKSPQFHNSGAIYWLEIRHTLLGTK